MRTDVLLQQRKPEQLEERRNQGLNAMSQAPGTMRKSLIEVQPSRNSLHEQDSPFMQMIHAQQSNSGLSDIDKRMMAINGPQKLGNFGGLIGGAAKQVVGIAFVSDKLLKRQRQFEVAADIDLHQILAAQNQKQKLKADFSLLGNKGHAPQLINRAVVRVQHVLPSIDKSEPDLYRSDVKDRSCDEHLPSHLGATSDFLECDVLEETEPVNRPRPKTEPLSEEEQYQLQIESVCSECRHGRVAEVKQAIQEGRVHVDDAVDKHGNTLLIIACQNNHKKIVKFLIKQGAEVTTKNHKGHDANHYAQLYKYKDICKYLM